ncbi:MAG: hypothetical protein ABFD69_00595 [Candidatus Sumerlaeia bacterium]
METVTLLVALCASLLVLVLRPINGLCVFAAALFLYPQRLTVEIFTLDFNVQRIVVVALCVRALCSREVRSRLRPNLVDLIVAIVWASAFFAYQLNVPAQLVLVREGGVLMDTLLPYAAVRMIVSGHAELIRFARFLALIAVPLAFFGVIQSVTGYNVVGFMDAYAAWGLGETHGSEVNAQRLGFYRATLTFGNYIAYGMFFPCAAALLLSLWQARIWPRPTLYILFGFMLAGMMASVSSGPLFAFVVMVAFLCCFPIRRYWPVGAALLLGGILFIEAFSNRHFYHVLTRLALSGESAYYRIKLFDEAFGGGMDGHWLAGYGYVGAGPGNDNSAFGWQQKDLVNMYVHRLARTGLIGTIPFVIMNIMTYLHLYQAARWARCPPDKWQVWALAGGIVGLNVALMTVAPLEQIMTMFYILIALSATLPMIMAHGGAPATRPRGYIVVMRAPRVAPPVAEARP